MIITPFRWLWKQFQGPQITAICTAIFQWFRLKFDDILTYWNDLSIDTANDYHLTTIGALQGISRPLMLITQTKFFWFSVVPQDGTYYPSIPYRKSEHGLSDLSDTTVGGKFADISEASKFYNYLPAPLFRAILQSARDSKGIPGSLEYLDDIIYGLFSALNGDLSVEPHYTFKIIDETEAETTHRCPGDIRIYLGDLSEWGDEFENVLAEINQLGKTIYYPVPTLFATADI